MNIHLTKLSPLEKLYGLDAVKKLSSSRVLVVGAGGIGCELIKNLVLLGIGNIVIVDLDIIDITNLNRQFLFQRKHVSMPKATVAASAVAAFNPNVQVKPLHADIKDDKFDIIWFMGFQLIINALDNKEARRHVNLMSLAAKIPMIDSGTGGYYGQSLVHLPNITKCYDCDDHITGKTYPVCTIRSTPSESIHCIVWVKDYLFPLLFQDQKNYNEETISLIQDSSVNEESSCEQKDLDNIRKLSGDNSYADVVFKKIFETDLIRLSNFSEMWATRIPPTPLFLSDSCKSSSYSLSLLTSKEILSFDQLCFDFINSIQKLAIRGNVIFDKDDDDAMRFLASTANLRCLAYGITQKNYFDIKSIAGNIVPIVATTNAIIAGVASSQAIAVLLKENEKSVQNTPILPTMFAAEAAIVRMPSAFLLHGDASPPLPNCVVCSRAYAGVLLDLNHNTLSDLIDYVCDVFPPLSHENISITQGSRLLYDPDETSVLEKSLYQLTIYNNSIMRFDCYEQDETLHIQGLSLIICKTKIDLDNQNSEESLKIINAIGIHPKLKLTKIISPLRTKRMRENSFSDECSDEDYLVPKRIKANPDDD